MSRHLQKLVTVISFIALLAATSFAAPMCALCAPSATHHGAVQPTESEHDHCGSAQTELPGAASITRSNCADDSLSCMVAPEPGKPAMPLASSIHTFFVPAAQVAEASLSQEDPLPPLRLTDLIPTPPLLATNLRV